MVVEEVGKGRGIWDREGGDVDLVNCSWEGGRRKEVRIWE